MDSAKPDEMNISGDPAHATSLIPLGSADAAACDGEFCVVPDHHTQAAVNRKVDEGLV